MDRLLRTLLSLGPSGAVANARAALDVRLREDWAVDVLVHHLERGERSATISARRAA